MPNDNNEQDTRAIARQAVEAEFRKKKKRGYDSSDDEGGKQQQQHGAHKKHKNMHAEGTLPPKKPTRPVAVWEVKYRDRAKERREGTEIIEKNNEDISVAKRPLPGEEAQNSLLDDVLEDEKEGQQNDQPIRGLDRSMIEREEKETADSRFVSTKDQAIEWLAQATPETSVSSSLGRELLTVLRQQHLPVTTTTFSEPTRAGAAVQRSTLAFSTDPLFNHNSTSAWQVPRQDMAAAGATASTATATTKIPKASPIHDADLLNRIKRVLNRQYEVEQTAKIEAEKMPQSKGPVDESDEDIFQIDDDEDGNDGDEEKKQPEKKNSPTDESSTKLRRTFFFNAPVDAPAALGVQDMASPAVAKLEGLSQVDRDYDVDFDGRLENEDEKKKKKRKRKKKGGDDSD